MTALTNELKKEYQTYNQQQLNNAFIEACKDGYLDIVKYLLISPELKIHADIHTRNDLGLQFACADNNLELIKYLLTSPDLNDHADIHANDDFCLQWASQFGHLDVVSYLLTSPDLKSHTNIHSHDDRSFQLACGHGQLEMVKYLLTSPDLKEHADIHASDDLAFLWACRKSRLNVVQYLLSFNGIQCIDFQNTEYDLQWAIENQFNDVIIAMMKNLFLNDFMQYLEWLPTIDVYNANVYEQVKNIKIDNLEVNPSVETSLLL